VRERRNVKYVAMVRNGLDVVRSWNPFVNQFRAEFRAQVNPKPATQTPKPSTLNHQLSTLNPEP
jgi:hypothetical protein